ncbi:MAG TPA: polysaccharide deacetylase family protein [Solirubrobacterales bacterium]
MSAEPNWPDGARGALSLSFDNLGEAAEIELGAIDADTELDPHPTVTEALPALLGALEAAGLKATFFVEGLNTERYPEALTGIAAAGHEVAYHAWRHEQWGDLSAEEQAHNLKRGLIGFRALGIEPTGLRPPGGLLGPGGLDVLREAGLRYCSPAGEGAGEDGGIALLPFQWRHLDASCVLPPLGTVREQIAGSAEPLDPGAFLAHLESEVERLARDGGYATFVLHPFMLAWFGEDRLAELLDLVIAASAGGDLWVAPCAAAAEYVLANPERFRGQTALDSTSWASRGG